jgi:hypothetical protein
MNRAWRRDAGSCKGEDDRSRPLSAACACVCGCLVSAASSALMINGATGHLVPADRARRRRPPGPARQATPPAVHAQHHRPDLGICARLDGGMRLPAMAGGALAPRPPGSRDDAIQPPQPGANRGMSAPGERMCQRTRPGAVHGARAAPPRSSVTGTRPACSRCYG